MAQAPKRRELNTSFEYDNNQSMGQYSPMNEGPESTKTVNIINQRK